MSMSMNKTSSRHYEQQSPERVYRDAHKFTKTLGNFTRFPSSVAKQTQINNLIEDKTASIRFIIDTTKYRKELYRKLEESDQRRRSQILQQLSERNKRISVNLQSINEKQFKMKEKSSKHFEQVSKKHSEMQKNAKASKQQQTVKLRKALLEFYAREQEKRKEADLKQIKVGTCYEEAKSRLENIRKKNEEYSTKTARQHENRMSRNSNKDKGLMEHSRLRSAQNNKKSDVYNQNCETLKEKQQKYIQVYAKDIQNSLKAFQHKQKTNQKTKQRVSKFFKERLQRWKSLKQRIDNQNQQVSSRCANILDKATKASFRQTMSSFRNSGKQWHAQAQKNKSMIYERDEAAKDSIVQTHLDYRLRNNASQHVNHHLGSMRDRAKKLSSQYI